MNKLNIQLNSNIEVVDTNTVAKLYLAATSISEPQEGELDLAYLSGNLLVNKAYRSQVDYLTDRFEDLNINVTDNYYIEFEDSEVLRVLLTNNIGDGVGVTELVAINSNIKSIFIGNSNVVNFNEYLYFTYSIENSSRCALFTNCSNLREITLPPNIVRIESNCFRGCTNLTSITIPRTLTLVGWNEFNDCTNLTYVNITDLASWCNCLFKSNPAAKAHSLYLNGELITDLIIPEGVTKLNNNVFSSVTSINTVLFPSSLITIGFGAFYNNNNITNIVIPDGVTTIELSAFGNCSNLTSVTIPDSCTSIDVHAFENCSSILYPTYNFKFFIRLPTSYEGNYIIPNGITTLCILAFRNCTGLTNVTIPNSVTVIASLCFLYCTGLTTITLPDLITSLNSGAFGYCSNLVSITLPLNLARLENEVFFLCVSLQNIVLPSSISYIGNWCFLLCYALLQITIYAETPPVVSSSTFDRSYPIYVPSLSVDTYKAAPGWSTYASRIQAIPST